MSPPPGVQHDATVGPRGGLHLSRSDLAILAGFLLVAWAVYRPDLSHSLDYVDFPDNILVLKAHHGFLARLGALIDTYREHGRFNPITVAVAAAQWSWFEWWAPGWHLVRFVVMVGVAAFAYLFFLALRFTRSGAFAGAAMFVVSPPAVIGWTRLSTAEPLGTLFLVVACLLALHPRKRGARWGLALLLLLVMWTKEIMAAAFLLPAFLVLASDHDLRTGESRLSHARRMVLPLCSAFLLGATPIIWTYLAAPAGSFASSYGSPGVALVDLLGSTVTALLPFLPVADQGGTIASFVLVALILLVLAGWKLAPRSSTVGLPHRTVLLLALGVPMLGALAYAPWPAYLLIYALPFMIGGAMLLVHAVSLLDRARGLPRILGATGLAIILSFSLAQAANDARRTRALISAVAASVARVAAVPGIDSVLVMVAPEQFDPRNYFGVRLSVYARARDLQWPPFRDVPCHRAPVDPPDRILVLRFSVMCADPIQGGAASSFPYGRHEWPDPRSRMDSIRVDIVRARLRTGA